MAFGARAAKGLAPKEHIIVDGCTGLRLVASATRKTWIYRYKNPIDGKMKQIALGQWPAVSYASAIVLWQDMRDRRNAGVDLSADKRRVSAEVKAAAKKKKEDGPYDVKRLIEDYLNGPITNRKPKGQVEARRLMLTGGYTEPRRC